MKIQSVLKIMFPNKHYHYLISTWKESVRKCKLNVKYFLMCSWTKTLCQQHWLKSLCTLTTNNLTPLMQTPTQTHSNSKQVPLSPGARAGESTWAQQPRSWTLRDTDVWMRSASIPELLWAATWTGLNGSFRDALRSAISTGPHFMHLGPRSFHERKKKTRSQSGGCITEFSRMYVPLFFPTHSVWLTCAGKETHSTD